MKKTYVAPLATEVSVATENVMQITSMSVNNEKTVSTKSGQLGNSQRGQWGDLWAK